MVKLGEETVQIPAIHQGKLAKEIVQQKKNKYQTVQTGLIERNKIKTISPRNSILRGVL